MGPSWAAVLVLAAAQLCCSAVPAQGTFYGSVGHKESSPLPAYKTQWYFPKLELTKKVSKSTKPCYVAPGLSALQPGCTHEYNFFYYWGKKQISVCADCVKPNYTYVFSTGHVPVCQCSKEYARNAKGLCVWIKPTPAPPPYFPPNHPKPTPWPGHYGWPHHGPHPHFPDPKPNDPHKNFYELLKKLFQNKDSLFDKLFGKIGHYNGGHRR